MNASGYADLVAKCPAGADWILADALGIDPIDPANWDMVQSRLRYWMADPDGIRRGDLEALRRLTTSLMITGFAMQAACSSRPVSGAEHQFSHLWDMEHHTHEGVAPSHGFKVGIGTLASLALYEVLMKTDIERLDVEARGAEHGPMRSRMNARSTSYFRFPSWLARRGWKAASKHIDRDALRSQLRLLQQKWPAIRDRLSRQLIPRAEVQGMLRAAGCPVEPEQIGISQQRLRESFLKAYHIRRRFTVLDLIRRANLWEKALDEDFQQFRTVTWKRVLVARPSPKLWACPNTRTGSKSPSPL